MNSRTFSTLPPRRLLLSLLALAVPLLSCGLKVDDLPRNNLPVITGAIAAYPDPATISPLKAFTLRVTATDADDDDLNFLWTASGYNDGELSIQSAGEWQTVTTDSVATWQAPGSFTEIDEIVITVKVYDYDQIDAVSTSLTIPVSIQNGDLLVNVVDIHGNEADVKVAIVGDDYECPAAGHTHLIEDRPWGNLSVIALDDANYYGAVLAQYDGGPHFDGYPQVVYNDPGNVDVLELVVVPKADHLQLPCMLDSVEYEHLSEGVALCRGNDLSRMILMPGTYIPDAEDLDGGGTAGVKLIDMDLAIGAFPGGGEVIVDAGGNGLDFGLYLEGTTTATEISGITITGAAASGAYLYRAAAAFDSLTFTDCGTTGVFLNGEDENDILTISNSACVGNDHGIVVSGGHLVADSLLIQDSHWYGVWTREGAAADLTGLTLVRNEIDGVYIDEDAGAVNIDRCLFFRNGRALFNLAPQAPNLSCLLYWANDHGDVEDSEIIVEDPLFADPDAGDWHLLPGSPALEAACGPIGAFPEYVAEEKNGEVTR